MRTVNGSEIRWRDQSSWEPKKCRHLRGRKKTSKTPQIFFVIPSKIGKAKSQEGCTVGLSTAKVSCWTKYTDSRQWGNYIFLSFVNVCVLRQEKNKLMGQLGEMCVLLKFFVSQTFPKSLLRGAGKGKEINFRLKSKCLWFGTKWWTLRMCRHKSRGT